jgi:GntR family transcriptional repressor for pyruvate dehydrogenase complex
MNSKLPKKAKFKKAPQLSEQVAKFLASKIEEGSLRPGEKLPPEALLAEQFGVSRTVIREAFARLKGDGLINSKHGTGSIVAAAGKLQTFRLDGLEQAKSRELGYLYEMRAVLEGYAAYLTAERCNQKDTEKMKRYLEDMAQCLEKGSDGSSSDLRFYEILVEASGNPYLRDFLLFLNAKLMNLTQKTREDSRKQYGVPMMIQQEHMAIFEAISRGDPEKAREAALAHIKNAATRLGITILKSI